jgi:hypothetical protein
MAAFLVFGKYSIGTAGKTRTERTKEAAARVESLLCCQVSFSRCSGLRLVSPRNPTVCPSRPAGQTG